MAESSPQAVNTMTLVEKISKAIAKECMIWYDYPVNKGVVSFFLKSLNQHNDCLPIWFNVQ